MEGWINVCSLSGRRIGKIPDEMYPDADRGWTHCDSLTAYTGCDPRGGAIFDTTSMASLVGIKGKGARYRFEDIVNFEPELSFIKHEQGVYWTYPNSLSVAWGQRAERIYRGQLRRAGKAAEHHILDVSSGSSNG